MCPNCRASPVGPAIRRWSYDFRLPTPEREGAPGRGRRLAAARCRDTPRGAALPRRDRLGIARRPGALARRYRVDRPPSTGPLVESDPAASPRPMHPTPAVSRRADGAGLPPGSARPRRAYDPSTDQGGPVASATMRELFEAGVHFGHQPRRWNPKMRRFIFGERAGIYVIDLQKTMRLLEESHDRVRDIAARQGTVLFVGTKKQARDAVAEHAQRAGMPYVNHRWLGGLLTNF